MKASRVLPIVDQLATYQKQWLRFDLLAGATTGAVVIPKAMAYATIAGLPVQVGLYTAFVPLIIYAIFGSSRPMSASTTTTIAILLGTELALVAPNGDAATLLQATALLTLMVGVILILASALRLGFLANFISEPVLIGFKAGIGVVIIVDQLPKILGIHFTKDTFLHNVQSIGQGLSHASLATSTAGVLTIVVLAVIEHFRPRWPAPLIAVALAIACVAFFGAQIQGIELVGAIPSGLPTLQVPEIALANQLWPAALGIALMSFTETAAVGRAFVKTGEPPPKPNTELFATGMASAVGAFFGSMPAGGGMSQTAVNRMSGARTQIAGLSTAGVSLLTMLFLAPLLALMPHAVLAGIVIFYSLGLIQPAEFRNILGIRRTEFVWAAAAFLGVMLIGTLQGILVAIVVSLVALAQQSANPTIRVLGRKPGTNVFRPRSSEHPDDESFPDLLLLRLEGRLFFLNAERVAEQLRKHFAENPAKRVVLDLSGVFDIEYSALKLLTQAEKQQREAGVEIWLAGLTPSVYSAVQRSPLGKSLGNERLVFNLEIAVDRYLRMHQA